MNSSNFPLSLSTTLKLDAATCAAMGGLLVMATDPVAQLTQIPAALLHWAGMILFPVAAFMAVWAFSSHVPRWALFVIVTGNIGWVAASLALPIFGFIAPNGLGWAFLAGQSAAVAAFAWLESVTAHISSAAT